MACLRHQTECGTKECGTKECGTKECDARRQEQPQLRGCRAASRTSTLNWSCSNYDGRATARQSASASPSAVDGGASVNGQISSEIARQSAVADIWPRMAKSPRLIRCKTT